MPNDTPAATDAKWAHLHRECIRCHVRKALSGFHRDRHDEHGRSRRCKLCANTASNKYYHDVRSGFRKRGRQISAVERAYFRRRNLRRHGITPEQWDALFASQGGACASCRGVFPPSENNRDRHTDHDHETGRVRGILCSRCNTGIGLASEDPERLRMMARYLERVNAVAVEAPRAVQAG